MLIDKEVEIRLNGKNLSYYESLGYTIPRYFNKRKNSYFVKDGTTIFINVKDLQKGSSLKVDIKCDRCNSIIQVIYYNYNRTVQNGIFICKHCLDCEKMNKDNNPSVKYPERIPRGEKQGNWKGGITPQYTLIRHSPKYINWRSSIFQRDNFTCLNCSNYGGKINIHHITNFAQIYDQPDNILYDETNVVTLCKKCHKDFHHIYGVKNNTKTQLDTFLLKSNNLNISDTSSLL